MNRLLFGRKQKVAVLLGNIDDGVSNAILHCTMHACRGEYIVTISSGRAQQVLEHAHRQKFDLCIVVLNNIIYPSVAGSDRRASALNLVTQLKQASLAPVIAFAGVTDDPSLPQAAVRAGADYFFWMPFDTPDFMEAVRDCLSTRRC